MDRSQTQAGGFGIQVDLRTPGMLGGDEQTYTQGRRVDGQAGRQRVQVRVKVRIREGRSEVKELEVSCRQSSTDAIEWVYQQVVTQILLGPPCLTRHCDAMGDGQRESRCSGRSGFNERGR